VPTTELDVLGTITCTGFATATGTFSGDINCFGTISAPFVTITTELFLNGADVVLANTNQLIGENSGAVQRSLAYVSGADVSTFGDVAQESHIHVDDSSGLQVKIGVASPVQIWHESNMGPGSGLDADLLDGVEGSAYMSWQSGDFFEYNFGVMSANHNYQIDHGFGTTPRFYQTYLLNIITDWDWQPDDIIVYQFTGTDSGSTMFANNTYVGTIINASPNILRKVSGFSIHSITWASWHLIIRAWK
jgi:hypothetical protein